MKRILLLITVGLLFLQTAYSQNVFDPNDPIIRYNPNAPYGSAEYPDIDVNGMQKWVSTASNGISTGGGSWDVSSYKAYFLKWGNTRMPFRLKFPRSFNNPDSAGKKYPVTLFFHGAGEFGCPSNNGFYNNEKQLVHGGKLFRDRVDNNSFDGFLLYPQVVDTDGCWGNWGSPTGSRFTIMNNILDSLAQYVRLDLDRVFVFGLSAGGKAAWNFTQVHPTRVAKAAPAAAVSGSVYTISNYIHIPIWFATGGKDTNPTPTAAAGNYNQLKPLGMDIKYTLYPTLGHAVWNTLWTEPAFVPFMNDMHKANPLVYFQKNEYCPDSVIDARIGITPGFYEYEWQKNNVTIAKRVNGVNTIIDGSSISSFTGNEMIVNSFGTYRVRFKRTASSGYSEWSPKPAVIKSKPITQTPPITVDGLKSKVLPSVDGSTLTPLTLPDGFERYEWYRVSDNVLLTTQQSYNAPVGVYKARVKEEFGCGALFSPEIKIVSANGTPKPEEAKNLSAFALSQTSIQLDWNENPNAGSNETGFEIYRSQKEGGPYTLIHITQPDITTYQDLNLPSNVKYFYVVRAVNNFGASAKSNEANATTIADNIAPTAPTQLLYRGSNQVSVSLRWKPSTDNVGVIRYDVFADDKKLYSTKNTEVTVFGLDSLRTYRFIVKAIDAAGNVSAPSNQVIGNTHRQGLDYKYYNGTWTNLPNFTGLNPDKTGKTDTVNAALGIRTQADRFAMYWTGWIYVPEAGTYTFETYSDDGSRMYVNTAYSTTTSTVNNDGSHSSQFRTGNATLQQGYNSVIITFFENAGGEEMQVWWTNTAAGITRERIPKGYFTYNNPGAFPNPAAPTNLVATSQGYNKIGLTWNDQSNNETGFEITRSATLNGTYLPIATANAGSVNYVDSGLNVSTQYFYKIRSISATGASAFTGASNATTAAAPAPPAAPQNLAATPLGVDAIQLEFDDVSNNETGFEIWRSVGNTNNFRRIITLPAGTGSKITHVDNSLFANITYYYKVRAAGIVTPSAYTAVINAKTLNTKPEIEQVLDFTMKFNTTFTLPVKATDVDGDALTFTGLYLPTFATLSTVSNGNLQIQFKPRISDQGAYSMMVIVDDGNLGKDTTFFTMVVDDNTVPLLSDVDNISMNEGTSLDVAVSAFDLEGNDFMTWYSDGMPSFASFQDNGDGTGVIKLRPGFSNSGEYTVRMFVDDGYGAWSSQVFNISVVEKDPNEKVQVNFRYFTGDEALWNDVNLPQDPVTTPPAPYINDNTLLNTVGEMSGIGVRVMSGTYTSTQNGSLTGNNSGVYPDNVLRDQLSWGFFKGNNLQDTVVLKLYGLKQSHKYNAAFFSSYTCTNCGSASSTVKFVNGDQTASVRYYLNTTGTDTLYNLTPDQNGEVLITMIGDPNNNWGGMLNALVINGFYDDGTNPAKPLDLTATAYQSLGVQLFWTDRSYNEDNYRIYRSTTANGPFNWINTNGSYKDSVSYLDNSVQPFTNYYYYVVGFNQNGEGTPSDTIAVSTLNNNPTITGLNNLFVKSDGSAEEEFAVNDDPSEVLTVTLSNKPNFVNLVSLGSNNYKLVLNPKSDDIGWYDVTVKVSDNQGGTSSQVVSITVADKFTRSVFVNLGVAGTTAPAPWNNWLGSRSAGSNISNLRDENNVVTPWNLRSMTKWTGTFDLGMLTGNNSGVFPDSVLQSGLTLTGTNVMQFRIGNLDPTKRYNVSFVGSMNEGLEAFMAFNSGTENDTLDTRYNTNMTANLNGLIPDATGVVLVNINRFGNGTVGYLNGLAIEEYGAEITLLNPANLYAEPLSRNSVQVYWSDRSVNENANNGYELQRSTDSLFNQNLVSFNLQRHINRYVDNSVQANTRYYYRVRARSGSNLSEFSNKAKVVTPETVVAVNFNYQVANAASPWNNLMTLPDIQETFPSMKDQSGVNTGISLAIENIFNGEFNAGKITGNNSGVAPDNVLQANFWLDNTQLSTIRVSGLNHSKRYRFGFIGSSSPIGWYKGNYTATYNIGGRTVYLNSWENSTKFVYISNVAPDENGEVIVNFSTTENANYGFNAGMTIMAYDDDDTTGLVDGARRLMQAPIVQQAEEAREISNMQVQAKAYPNPFIEQINIDFFNTASSNNVTVDVVDLSGRMVYRKQVGQVPAGPNTLRMNTGSSLKHSGIYLVNLRVNGKVAKTVKMVKTNK